MDQEKDTFATASLKKGVNDMKQYYKKGGSFALSALITSLICGSLPMAQASDIDIYQEAKSGDVTLMFVIDISGSMGYPQIQGPSGDSDPCDLPDGSNYLSFGNENSTNGSPIYKRYYCSATGSNKLYKYRSYVSSRVTYYQVCNVPQANYVNCTWQSASRTVPSLTTNGTDTINGYTYYYSSDVEKFYDRITRVKDGMFDLLNGNSTKNIPKLADDKVIGLSTYSTPLSFNSAGEPLTADNVSGQIRIPARRLDQIINGVTQRQLLLNEIAKIGARGGTPTANAYAEAASYLMGTTTGGTERGIIGRTTTTNTSRFYSCITPTSTGGCNSYSNTYSSLPAYDSLSSSNGYYYFYKDNIANSSSSGFGASSSDSKNSTNYIRPSSITSQINNTQGQQCSGQGIYVLTDGVPSNNTDAPVLMKKALASSSFSCTSEAKGWDCINKFNLTLLDKAQNPVGLKFKTAVVGFGKDFTADDLKSYDKNLTQAQNIANINSSSAGDDQKNAAKWGVYGEGGWYSGSSSDDVVSSVNNFINNLNTDIPAVTTGSPTIPVDELNTIALQPWAYFPQFQPTPDKNYQIWFGNVKKYKNLNGVLKDRNDTQVMSTSGEIVKDTIDYWAPTLTSNSTDAEKAVAKIGGALMKLPLRYSTANVNNNTVVTQRKLLTDRTIINASTGVSQAGSNLIQINKDYIIDATTKADPDRGYLMSLLGYRVDATNPSSITATSLQKAEELRQLGGVMHSSPVLLTQKGRIVVQNGKVTSTNRDDYVMFGSTQGLLHVVDAVSGVEKFAFVPDEMIRNQKDAFLDKTVTTGGLSKMYYGVDGPWTVYTSYVPTGTEGYLTVGSGKYSAKGRQLVYGGLRMGGRSYYSLDLSNIDSPVLKFRISPDNASSGSPLSYMGQSWSKPTIAWIKWKGVRKLVMFVGGGYDAGGTTGNGVNGVYQGYEDDNYNQISKIGAGVYMFDADNGDLLWWTGANVAADNNTKTGINAKKQSDMKYSVVSRINTVDRNTDGLVDHLYFGDLGGQLWRVDLDNTLISTSTDAFAKNVIRLLNLNLANGKSPRFYDAPVFTIYNEPTIGRFAVINIGSGNRSKPLAEYTGDEAATGRYFDAVYALYDKDVASNKLYELTTFITTDKTRSNLTEVTNRSTKVGYSTADGWYYKLKKGSKLQSEKVFGDLIAINYNLYIGTFDGSKPGLSGDCGAGVKGESFVERLCLPYSDCSTNPVSTETNADKNRISLGAGIILPVLGGGEQSCTGNDCDSGGGSTADPTRKILSNCQGASCGVVTIGNVPKQRLIPLRWYEEYANPAKVGS